MQECINNYLPQSIKHAMMCDIAWSMQRTAGEGGPLHSLISRDALLTVMQKSLEHHTHGIPPDIIACALIRLLDERHSVLCYVGDRWYSFIHRTFLEYYVAKAVELQWNDRSIDEGDLNNIFIAHGADPTWHEVLGHVSGLIHPKFIGPCLHHLLEDDNAALAAKCMPMLRASDGVADQMAQNLRELVESLSKLVEPSSDPTDSSTLAGLSKTN
jgi:predicted NACHT family NTPase